MVMVEFYELKPANFFNLSPEEREGGIGNFVR